MRTLSRARTRRALSAAAGLAVVAAGPAGVSPASANSTGTGLVISEVYGAGGNSGAVYNADYVELYNPTSAPISLTGDYLHYRSALGVSGGTPFALSGSLPAGSHYLVQMGAAGSTGAALTPDATAVPAFSMAAGGGQVFLLDSSSAVTTSGNMVGTAGVVDMVGANGSTSYETQATTSAASATGSLNRTATGTDSDNNSSDFSLAAPSPSACGTACSGTTTPPPTAYPIAQIQGTDTGTSPHVGETVITRGVVTADYATGGFNGFYLQTAGTGGSSDATPGASDAVFVFGSAAAAKVHPGDYVEVQGKVSEFAGTTEIGATEANTTVLPDAHDPVTPAAIAYPTTEAAREAHEGELVAPTNDFTVTDNVDLNSFGEVGLATGDHQLVQPSDVADPTTDPAGIAAVLADNAARGVVLDDGASTSFLSAANKGIPLPWLTTDNPVRIGSSATLHQPVILEFRNGAWDFQPTAPVTDQGTAVATFGDTRAENAAPRAVGGDLRLATFNVENFFPTSAADYQALAAGNTCTSFNDRTGTPITVNQCSPNGPRGAWDATNLQRQLDKEIPAINTLDADVVSLEEIENSVQFGKDRDAALGTLVAALNAAAGTTRWAYVPSPAPSDLPPTAEQDVIRTAFIYNPARVQPVGSSVVLSGLSESGEAFANAREPLAQEFKRAGALDSDGFLVVVNHFKSKGDSNPKATGDNAADPVVGAFNGDRVRQAHALVDFAQQVATARATQKVFLVGDFNSYTHEDPMQVLYDAGYLNEASDDSRDVSYEFGGTAGSLDHVLASPAAAGMVTGRDVWQINAEESVAFEYSRYNYNATLLYQRNQFRASDHNPELVGLDAPYSQQGSTVAVTASPQRLQRRKDTSTVTATVTGAQGVTPTGTVQFWVGDHQVASATLVGGTASTVVGPFPAAGTQTVEVRYLGDTVTQSGTGTVALTVTTGNPK
jgi:predicted extracellular nuclease